jgi:hypothetical protein
MFHGKCFVKHYYCVINEHGVFWVLEQSAIVSFYMVVFVSFYMFQDDKRIGN